MMMMMMEMQHPHHCDDGDNGIVQRGRTLLHIVAVYGTDVLLPEMVSRGAEVDARDVNGATPLMLAFDNGRESTALALIRLGADPTARDNKVR